MIGGKGGKHRSKKECEKHHHEDPQGHSRKLVTKMQNTEAKKKTEPTGPVSRKPDDEKKKAELDIDKI